MDFAFRRPCPVECEAYSSGVSEKQSNKSFLCDHRACPVAPGDGTGASAVNNLLPMPLYQDITEHKSINPNIHLLFPFMTFFHKFEKTS